MNNYDRSIALLGKGFIKEFIQVLNTDEELMEMVMDLAAKFVEDNIPVVEDDAKIDVASELLTLMTITHR